MVHENFHHIDGRDHIAIGHALGETFGEIVAEYVEEEREDDDWPSTVEAAAAHIPITKRYFPDLIDELEAYAAAAKIPFRELWATAIEADLDTAALERCTTVVTNQGRLIAHNEDWDGDAAEDICILKTTRPGLTVLEIYYYGCPLGGVALSMSSNGYIQAINSVEHADTQRGVPRSVFARATARIANLDSDLPALLEIPRASGFAHTIVDRAGRIVSLECSATRHALSRPQAPFAHTNHYLEPSLQAVAYGAPSASSSNRCSAAQAMVKPAMTPETLQLLMDDQSKGKRNSIHNSSTIARALVDFDQQTASMWLKQEKRRGWIDYPVEFVF
jgi:predicted choloylglycine hydrolase